MITNQGKVWIPRYLARQIPSIAESIAFGIGASVESISDTRLNFEVDRANIRLTSYDYNQQTLIFKAVLPIDVECVIYELGLYSMSTDAVAGPWGSKPITSFDKDLEDWRVSSSASTFTSGTNNADTRIGTEALIQAPASSGSVTDHLDTSLDLSGHSSADIFKFAYFIGNANIDHAIVRLMTDSSNYFAVTLSSVTAGFNSVSITKGSFTATGSPSWGDINKIEVQSFATSGGTGDIRWDGIRLEDIDTINPDYLLVARKVLATPFVKVAGKEQEVEFAMAVTIN